MRALSAKVGDKGGRKPLFSFEILSFVVLLRTLCGWGALRIAAELGNKGMARISHQTVQRIFRQYHLPTKTYHPKGKSNGIRSRRYRRTILSGNGHPIRCGTLILQAHFSSLNKRCTCWSLWTITPGSLWRLSSSPHGKPHRSHQFWHDCLGNTARRRKF